MAFAPLTYRESLRDIEACLRARQAKLYPMGIRGTVSRNTLANADEKRDWRIYADLAQALIGTARLRRLNRSAAFFVVRGRASFRFRRLYSRRHPEASLYTTRQVLSVTAFEKIPRRQALTDTPPSMHRRHPDKQLILFD